MTVLLTALALLPPCAQAQQASRRAEFSVGYSYLRSDFGDRHGSLVGGGMFSAAYFPLERLGMVLEASTHHGTIRGANIDTTLVLFGPRMYFLRSRLLEVFGHLLSGFHYAQVGLPGLGVAGDDDTGFALAAGFGFNVPWRGRLALRVLQVDYVTQDVDLPARVGKIDQLADNFRLSAGLLLHWGR